MRSAAALVVAIFGVATLAMPAVRVEKRALVTDYDIAYVTEYVTVTAVGEYGASYTTPTPSSTDSDSNGDAKQNHWGHHWHTPSTSASLSSTEEASTQWPTTTPEAQGYNQASSDAAPQSTQTSTPSYGTSGSTYNQKVIDSHNIHRANHSAPDLVWDDDLASIAEDIANSCVYAHDTKMGGGGYGQNIAAGVNADNVDEIITNLFYNSEISYFDDLYGETDPDMTDFELWGHFSQIVWIDSTKVGCASVKCDSLENVGGNVAPIFTVCNYSPAGNYGGEYANNVKRPKGMETVTVEPTVDS